jgi:hypothetical protein
MTFSIKGTERNKSTILLSVFMLNCRNFLVVMLNVVMLSVVVLSVVVLNVVVLSVVVLSVAIFSLLC